MKLEELLREILGAPAAVKPPLGPNPFSGSAPAAGTARTAGPTGVTPSGHLLLDDAWFANGAGTATGNIAKLKLSGHMELRFSLHAEINKSQLELLNAVKASEIRTFGWPIGVVMNRDEFRPLPYEGGIRAEISIAQGSMSGGARRTTTGRCAATAISTCSRASSRTTEGRRRSSSALRLQGVQRRNLSRHRHSLRQRSVDVAPPRYREVRGEASRCHLGLPVEIRRLGKFRARPVVSRTDSHCSSRGARARELPCATDYFGTSSAFDGTL